MASEVVDNRNGTYRYPSSPLEAQSRGSVTDPNLRAHFLSPPDHSVSYYPTVSGTYTFYVADLAGSHLAGSPYAAGLFPPGIRRHSFHLFLEVPQLTNVDAIAGASNALLTTASGLGLRLGSPSRANTFYISARDSCGNNQLSLLDEFVLGT